MPITTPEAPPAEPVLYLTGGTDELQLEDGGRVYRPGDPMPKSLSHRQQMALQAIGIRFETRHPEPVVTPEGKPAELAAAEQIEGPAVVAAVEDRPTAEAKDEQQPAPRASRRGD